MGLYSCCGSCDDTSCPNHPANKAKYSIDSTSEEPLYIKDKDGQVVRIFDVYTVEYRGHKYMLFDGYSDNACFVHDPDCDCHKNEKTSGSYFDW